jgi:hypothetical protein
VEAVRNLGEEAPVYNLRVADYHTYFVGRSKWGFSVWAHNTSCDAEILGRNLEAAGEVRGAGQQAAHIVPTGAFSRRPSDIVTGLVDARRIINDAGIGINSAENGFFAVAGHNGAHTNDFFRNLITGLRKAEADENVSSFMAALKSSLE